MSLKLNRSSADAYRIDDEQGDVVYMAIRLTNDRWGAFDADEKRVNTEEYASPTAVLGYFETLE